VIGLWNLLLFFFMVSVLILFMLCSRPDRAGAILQRIRSSGAPSVEILTALVRAHSSRGNLSLAASALEEMCARSVELGPPTTSAFSALLLAYSDRDMAKEVMSAARSCSFCR
jgi:pentatricopeptide repeat protein